ncbi:MAG: hypothetical protein QOE90_1532 [Thermoplasmata archaeon]|jgi:hypothetical protein|nr:hypothetical protein [Thermoplasmata archaeon]
MLARTAILLLLLAAPVGAAMTEQEVADQVTTPTAYCASPHGMSATLHYGSSADDYLLKLGSNLASDSVTLYREAPSGLDAIFTVRSDGTLLQSYGAVPMNTVAAEDNGNGGWSAIVHLDLRADPYSPHAPTFRVGSQQACYYQRVTAPTDPSMAGFVTRFTNLEDSNTSTSAVVFHASAANGTTSTLPTVQDLQAIASSPSSLTVTWDAVTGATSYAVTLDGTPLYTTNTTAVSITGLAAESDYGIGVTARDAWRTSHEATTIGTTSGIPPTPPTSGPLAIGPQLQANDSTAFGILSVWFGIILFLVIAGALVRHILE